VARLSEAWRATARRLYIDPSEERRIVAAFERTYRESDTDFRWSGEKMATPPVDLWVYQEIVHETAPDLIIAATENAGYLAAICQLTGTGHVLWIGGGATTNAARPARLRALAEGPSSAVAVAAARDLAAGEGSVLVVLGPSPDGGAVLEQLRLYGALVTAGSYLIVEDTHADDQTGERRAAAVEALLREDRSFAVDHAREKFYLSFNRGGYLRRVGTLAPSSGRWRRSRPRASVSGAQDRWPTTPTAPTTPMAPMAPLGPGGEAGAADLRVRDASER
jgi:cephalosporin hydroxylase